MIDIFLLKDKKLECKTRKQKIYEGENKFDYIYVNLSEYVNEFDVSELNAELRCYVDDEHYVSYELDTSKEINEIDITYDLTDKPRYVKSLIILTKAGEVIGKTNFVSFSVDKSIEGSKLDPREDLDEIIEELREENASQAETISEQTTEITEKDGQISELNGQVTELEAENAKQAETITRQNTTINELNERRTPVYIPAKLEPKLITHKDTTEYYPPSEDYDGFSAVTVEGATVEKLNLNENYYKFGEPFLDKVGKYNPFPENTYGGIYFTELNENDFPVGIKVVNYDYNYNNFSVPVLNINTLINNIKSFILLGCKNVRIQNHYFDSAPFLTICCLDGVLTIGVYAFANCASLTEVNLTESITSIGDGVFGNCSSLTEISLPNSLTSMGGYAFVNCSSLTEINLPNSLTSIGGYAFSGCKSLTNLTLAQGFNCNGLNVSASTRFSAETLIAMLEALADRTGQTAYTLTIGTTNINKLTAEQRAIATNKNWNLA